MRDQIQKSPRGLFRSAFLGNSLWCCDCSCLLSAVGARTVLLPLTKVVLSRVGALALDKLKSSSCRKIYVENKSDEPYLKSTIDN